MTAAVSETQWLVGWIVGAAVVVVVVLLVGTVIFLAARIRAQLAAVLEALTEARDNTAPLWDVQTTNQAAGDILEAARAARGALEG
jgi:ATP/ADP translocase